MQHSRSFLANLFVGHPATTLAKEFVPVLLSPQIVVVVTQFESCALVVVEAEESIERPHAVLAHLPLRRLFQSVASHRLDGRGTPDQVPVQD